MHDLLQSLQTSPPGSVLLRNWQVGRYLHQQLVQSSQPGTLPEYNKMLAPTPMRGMAAQLERFYRLYPSAESLIPTLSWGHYRAVLRLSDSAQRAFYLRCAQQGYWSVGHLERQIKTDWQLRQLPPPGDVSTDQWSLDWLRKPVVLDFVAPGKITSERDLEQHLIDHLSLFLLELGTGLAFVARQMRLQVSVGKTYVIDLVFYHYRHRHFVLLELKLGELTAQDIGQLDTYVHFFDDLWKAPTDGPTIGILLCRKLDENLVQHSLLHNSRTRFALPYQYGLARL